MNRSPAFFCFAILPLLSYAEKWSPEEGSASFEPSDTVLEQWSGIGDRSDKVMKKPDRYIMNRPASHQQGTRDKEVSETDLFLLGAIEKLAYRMEYLEKRVARTEELLYGLVAGTQTDDKQDSCPEHFKRFGNACYHFSGKQVNWKSASSACRSLGSALLEFDNGEDEKSFLSSLQRDTSYQGKDYWTGGLNPGLLWIWSNSAKPVLNNSTSSTHKTIEGNGRCLLLKYQALNKGYIYKGIDCSTRNYYVCRHLENAIGRKLERLQRELRFENHLSATSGNS